MKIIKRLGRALKGILLALLLIVLLSNAYLIGAKKLLHVEKPTVFGWAWAVVITGSMEPVISGNDMVVTRAEREYAVGDIIMFENGGTPVTHRIVDSTEEGFITQGDANNAADTAPVPEDRIVGKVMFIVPKIGVAMAYLKTPLGLTCLAVMGFLLMEIPYLFGKSKNEQDEGCE